MIEDSLKENKILYKKIKKNLSSNILSASHLNTNNKRIFDIFFLQIHTFHKKSNLSFPWTQSIFRTL